MAQMKTLAYDLHEEGRCVASECAWCTPPSVPSVHAGPSVPASLAPNSTPGGDGGSDQWRVTDLGSADWCMRKVAKLDRESAAISDTAADEIDTITKWRDAEFARIAPQREHWTWLLADFHEKQLLEDPMTKTISLPHGKLVARRQPDNIEIADPDDYLTVCVAKEEGYYRVKYEIDRAALKEAVLKDGEIILGVEVVEGQIKYSVAPN